MGRYITHDDDSTHYWGSRKMAERHIRLMARRGVILNLYREREPECYGPGVILKNGNDLLA